jgi:hypothetical protein
MSVNGLQYSDLLNQSDINIDSVLVNSLNANQVTINEFLNLHYVTPSKPLKVDAEGNVISDSIDLASDEVKNVLPIAKGGTNSFTPLTNNKFMMSLGGSIVEATELTDGQIFIGSSSSAPVASSITGTTNRINVTNGPGSITLSTPQDIATSSDVTFNSVTATNGTITTATIPTLTSTTANITTANITTANINALTGTTANITTGTIGTLTSTTANINALTGTTANITTGTIGTLTTTTANINALTGTTANITTGTIGTLTSTTANINALTGTTANITTGTIGTLTSTTSNITTLTATNGNITTATIPTLTSTTSNITGLISTNANITTGTIGTLTSTSGTVNSLTVQSMSAYTGNTTGTLDPSISLSSWYNSGKFTKLNISNDTTNRNRIKYASSMLGLPAGSEQVISVDGIDTCLFTLASSTAGLVSATNANITTGTIGTLTSTTSNITNGNITTLTSTSGNITTGTIGTLTSTTGNITTLTATSGTITNMTCSSINNSTINMINSSTAQSINIGTNASSTISKTVNIGGNNTYSAGQSLMRFGGKAMLEFGSGITKENNAGKIGYQMFSSGLDIVGAGTSSNRLIKMWEYVGVGADPSTSYAITTSTSPSFFSGKVGVETAPHSSSSLITKGDISMGSGQYAKLTTSGGNAGGRIWGIYNTTSPNNYQESLNLSYNFWSDASGASNPKYLDNYAGGSYWGTSVLRLGLNNISLMCGNGATSQATITDPITVISCNSTSATITQPLDAQGGITLPTTGGTPANLNYYESNTTTLTFSGAIPSTAVTVAYNVIGNVVSIKIKNFLATTTSSNVITSTALPVSCRPPLQNLRFPVIVTQNGLFYNGSCIINTSGTITLYTTAGGGVFTSGLANSGLDLDAHFTYCKN